MEAKIVFAFCFQLLCLKYTFAQCLRAPVAPELINARTASYPTMSVPFASEFVMEIPSLPPPSFSIFADGLVVDGLISVTGSMPFLGTVTLGGTVPTAGQGSVLYSCGNGEVGIVNEMPAGAIETFRSNPMAWNNARVIY